VILPLLLAAAAATPEAVPPEIARGMPPHQHVVQTLRADLNHDGRKEWIAVGEPDKAHDRGVLSVGIFEDVKGKPKLAFRQYLETKQATRAGAVVRDVPPVGQVVIVVAADPDADGNDSTFTLQIYGFHAGAYRQLLPEQPRFASQGGFTFEDRMKDAPGLELVVWTYLAGDGEATWDDHRYALDVFHFENGKWVGQDRRTFTDESFPTFEAAAKGLGIQGADLRRQIPRVAEVP
jgi:hypothetical protein